jgi:membrane protein implicated in regulation of membrane protease activity
VSRRFKKLYEDFKPEFIYWKLALLSRKFALAVVAIMLDKNPMFQVRPPRCSLSSRCRRHRRPRCLCLTSTAWSCRALQASLCVAVLFIAYIAQQRVQPFVSAVELARESRKRRRSAVFVLGVKGRDAEATLRAARATAAVRDKLLRSKSKQEVYGRRPRSTTGSDVSVGAEGTASVPGAADGSSGVVGGAIDCHSPMSFPLRRPSDTRAGRGVGANADAGARAVLRSRGGSDDSAGRDRLGSASPSFAPEVDGVRKLSDAAVDTPRARLDSSGSVDSGGASPRPRFDSLATEASVRSDSVDSVEQPYMLQQPGPRLSQNSTGRRRMTFVKLTRVLLRDYNNLESTFLITAILILLSGMVFLSGGFPAGSVGYVLMTVIVAFVIITCVTTFVALLAFELYKSFRDSERHEAERREEADRMEALLREQGSVGRTRQPVRDSSGVVRSGVVRSHGGGRGRGRRGGGGSTVAEGDGGGGGGGGIGGGGVGGAVREPDRAALPPLRAPSALPTVHRPRQRSMLWRSSPIHEPDDVDAAAATSPASAGTTGSAATAGIVSDAAPPVKPAAVTAAAAATGTGGLRRVSQALRRGVDPVVKAAATKPLDGASTRALRVLAVGGAGSHDYTTALQRNALQGYFRELSSDTSAAPSFLKLQSRR